MLVLCGLKFFTIFSEFVILQEKQRLLQCVLPSRVLHQVLYSGIWLVVPFSYCGIFSFNGLEVGWDIFVFLKTVCDVMFC